MTGAVLQAVVPLGFDDAPTEQAAIVGGGLAKLIVLPDGPLALLPFEALVVERGDAPTYLIDVGPPMHYGPSATILMNLRQRTRAATQDENPVLSVGDPQYSPASQSESDTTSDSQRMQTRYTSLGGKLPRLPFTALESTWVNDVFDDTEAALKAAHATAAEIAANSPLAVRGTKDVLDEGRTDAVAASLRYVAAWNSAFLPSKDLKEGIASMLQKREPHFTGE